MAPTDPDPAPDLLWEQALTFLMEMREAPQDAALRQAWKRWMAEAPQHREAWARAELTWLAMGQAIRELPPAWPPPLPPVRSTLPPPLPARPIRAQGRRGLLLATGGGALAAGALLAAPGLGGALWQRLQADLRTSAGETRALQLPDGSRLELDTATAVALEFSAAGRRLRLLQGQAFIAVARAVARPLLLRCGVVEVSAPGAAINLRFLGDRLEIALEDGQARARYAPAAGIARDFALEARQSLTLSLADGAPLAPHAPLARALAWRHHRLVAEDTPLRAVLAELGRYLPGLLWLRDRALGEARVSDAYDLRDIPAAIRQAVAPLGGRVREVSPYLVMVGSA
ncbi:hypothetical protein BKE38_04140 [Pseudoroseomonas deserti]|uniref:FecR protein domain-containing protein n=1 Tax=Teichococcus deserti TaxID=1817963 RepID=A0A1V2H7P7_9PROT|nr:FecR domain-containing protein [Pseudoroseomonas deserti]ONG57349.1 hypothetical protein BKE38_04140 [Pseudoroseomonas deserti]